MFWHIMEDTHIKEIGSRFVRHSLIMCQSEVGVTAYFIQEIQITEENFKYLRDWRSEE